MASLCLLLRVVPLLATELRLMPGGFPAWPHGALLAAAGSAVELQEAPVAQVPGSWVAEKSSELCGLQGEVEGGGEGTWHVIYDINILIIYIYIYICIRYKMKGK